MKFNKKHIHSIALSNTLALIIFLTFINDLLSQSTYCNPINIDYAHTPIPRANAWGHHRSTADPVIVRFKNDYYLFSTNQWGYWVSPDMLRWNFIPRKFLRPWNKGY